MTHNVLLVYRVDGPLDANVPLTVIGSAIYEDITLMNHSCAANTTRFYQASNTILQIISFICFKEIANLANPGWQSCRCVQERYCQRRGSEPVLRDPS